MGARIWDDDVTSRMTCVRAPSIGERKRERGRCGAGWASVGPLRGARAGRESWASGGLLGRGGPFLFFFLFSVFRNNSYLLKYESKWIQTNLQNFVKTK